MLDTYRLGEPISVVAFHYLDRKFFCISVVDNQGNKVTPVIQFVISLDPLDSIL
jgi:hypothetical protein